MIAARADRPNTGRVNLAIERLNFFDLLFEIVSMRKAHVAQVGYPAKLVRIHAQREIEAAHEA